MRGPRRLPILLCSLVAVALSATEASTAMTPFSSTTRPANDVSVTVLDPSPAAAADSKNTTFWQSLFAPAAKPDQKDDANTTTVTTAAATASATATAEATETAPTTTYTTTTSASSSTPAATPQPDSQQNATFSWFDSIAFWRNRKKDAAPEADAEAKASSDAGADPVADADPPSALPMDAKQSGSKVSAGYYSPMASKVISTIRLNVPPTPTAAPAVLFLPQSPPPVEMLRGHRAASFAERVSTAMAVIGQHIVGSIDGVAKAVRNVVPDPPSVLSVNSTMIVAHVPTRFVGTGASDVAVSHISINDGKLSMVVRLGNAAGGGAVREETVKFGLSFPSDVARVTQIGHSHAERLSSSMSTLYISIKKMNGGAQRIGVVKAVRVAGSAQNGGAEGGHLEEDRYEFLESYMNCKKQFGGPSLKTSLCTCEHQHSSQGSEELQTACVGRVVDRAFRIARRIGEERLSARLYRDAFACRQRKQGSADSVKARKCLYLVLEKHVLGSLIDYPQIGRKLMTAYRSDSVEEGTDSVGGSGENDVVRTKASRHSTVAVVSVRILAVMAYLVGLAIILAGLQDIAAYYRRHQNSSHRRGHLDQLPETARALYSRVFS